MKKSGFLIILLWGLLTSCAMFLLVFFSFQNGMHYETIQYTGLPVLFGGLVMVMLRYRKKVMGGSCHFAELFKIGMLMTLVCSVIFSVFFIIFLNAYPSLVTKMGQMVLSNKVSGQDISTNDNGANGILSIFFTPLMMGLIKFFANVVQGAIFSLIAAAMLSKGNPSQISRTGI